MNHVTPPVHFRDDLTPGESFRAPARLVVPHAGDFWHEPKHVIECIRTTGDEELEHFFATYPVQPVNNRLTNHWVYGAIVRGDTHTWRDEDTTIHWLYLGIYRLSGLHPVDWSIDELDFTADV